MALILELDTPYVSVGFPTWTYTVPSTGLYVVRCQLTTPLGTGLIITVNQNGTPVYTSPAIAPTQTSLEFVYSQLYSTNDVITVTHIASSPADGFLNVNKVTVSIGQGTN